MKYKRLTYIGEDGKTNNYLYGDGIIGFKGIGGMYGTYYARVV